MFRKKRTLVGLDIGSSTVKAVELTEFGNQLCITGFGSCEVKSKESLADTVAETFRHAGIKSKRVATAVSGRSVIVRYINMVNMSEADLKGALRFEADKYIPFELDEVVLDCVKLEEFGDAANTNKEMKVLLVAVKRNLIDERVDLMQTLGLTPTVIDVDSFALGNAFELNSLNSPKVDVEEKVIALIDIGAVKTNINILKGSTSYFSREVYLAGNDFTEFGFGSISSAPLPAGRIMKCRSTLLRGISSRTTVNSSGLSEPSRRIVMWTVVPLGPFSRSATSPVLMLSVGLPSTAAMMSPGRIPAR